MDQTLLSAITQQRRRRILQIHHHHNQDHLHHYYYRSAQRYRQNAALLVHLADRALDTLPEGLLLKLGIVTGAQAV